MCNLSTIEEIHRWGCAASEAIQDFPSLYFRTPNVDGFIGYRIMSGCAIVFGDPVCPREQESFLAEAFHLYCRDQNLNPVYIIASERFAKWAINSLCHVMIEVGEDLIFDPQKDPLEGHKAQRLRNKVHHALHHDLEIHEYFGKDEKLEQEIQQVGEKWLNARHGPQLHIGDLNFFNNREGKRWFYVKEGENITGMALLSKLEAREGWLLKYLITLPKSYRGTSELLMISILETLRKENCHFVTCGMVPAESLDEIVGLNRFSAWLAKFVFQIVKWFFKLKLRKNYWEKFQPTTERTYVLFGNPHIGLKEILAVIKAFKIDC